MLIDELYLSHLCPAIKTKEGVGRFSRHFEAAVIERQSSVLHGGPRDTARKLRQQIEQHWSVRPVREGLWSKSHWTNDSLRDKGTSLWQPGSIVE